MGNFNQKDYYHRVLKPKRERERAEKAAKLGLPRLKAGRKSTKPEDGTMELHLFFSGEVAAFIEEQSGSEKSYQAWFDRLVAQAMECKTNFQPVSKTDVQTT